MIANKITIEFNKIKESITDAYIAVGMVTDDKFDFFMRNVSPKANIALITGIHLPTPPKVLQKLKESNFVRAKAYTRKFFHPKLYLFKTNNDWIAFVGSGNFTNGGWHENEELFIKITDQIICQKLKEKFDSWFDEAVDITNKFLEVYSQIYFANLPKQKELQSNTKQLLDLLNNTFNINNIDFSGQFFIKSDHQAFEPGKTHLETVEILGERSEVRRRLFELNDLLVAAFPREWSIYPHYENEHIVAHIENHFHHDFNVKALWIAYGRNRQELKEYGDWATPLLFMRMQVIVRYNEIGIWLMPGKQGAGQIDRENFALRMREIQFRSTFFNLIKKLGDSFWIEIAGDIKPVLDFETPEALWEFTTHDNWRNYYFTIGKNFKLGTAELSKTNIVETILDVFGRFIPIYNLIKDNSLINEQ